MRRNNRSEETVVEMSGSGGKRELRGLTPNSRLKLAIINQQPAPATELDAWQGGRLGQNVTRCNHSSRLRAEGLKLSSHQCSSTPTSPLLLNQHGCDDLIQ